MNLNQVGDEFWVTLVQMFIPIVVFGGLSSVAFFWAMSSAAEEQDVRNTVFLIKALGFPTVITYFLARNGYDVIKTWNDVSTLIGQNRMIFFVTVASLAAIHILFVWILFPRFVYSTKFVSEIWKKASEADRQRMLADFLRRYTFEDWHGDKVEELLGEPTKKIENRWYYQLPDDRRLVIEFAQSGRARVPRVESRF